MHLQQHMRTGLEVQGLQHRSAQGLQDLRRLPDLGTRR